MNIEQTLADELAVVARTVDAPPAPAVADLVRRAESVRVRTRVRVAGTILAAAAAVLAVILTGVQVGRPNSSPSPAPQPTKTPTTFKVGDPLKTYVDPTTATLYLDGVAERGHWTSATTTGDLTTATVGSDQSTVAVFLGTSRVGTLRHVAQGGVKVSPDSRRIAWVEQDQAEIVAAEVSPAGVHELGRRHVEALLHDMDSETRETLLAVDDDGTVTYGGVVAGHSWTPGSEPRDADISAYLYSPAGFPGQVDDIRLNHEGTWGAWMTGENDPGTDGSLTFRAVTVQHRDQPGTRATLTMPKGLAALSNLYWESETDVILTIGEDGEQPSEYVRCDVVRKSCELAPGWGDH